MSARSYALQSVCAQLSYSIFSYSGCVFKAKRSLSSPCVHIPAESNASQTKIGRVKVLDA